MIGLSLVAEGLALKRSAPKRGQNTLARAASETHTLHFQESVP
ncbi:hypothetical protein LTSEMON_1752 [Salmonella enterica subsp. enterica serovar Montevideo str. S5-403]|uniref:Uncharacterized protein n=1 Tax=Salmonella enterica subsp. enterica serovar Montevideo str. S5-403 TaxID=913242 RepID=G5Q1M2_SALMO|nr:hypothetical protein LTSEMON_1752 [Salmonella enterica subsp. enterica serovar Montevideo str. S5-403]